MVKTSFTHGFVTADRYEHRVQRSYPHFNAVVIAISRSAGPFISTHVSSEWNVPLLSTTPRLTPEPTDTTRKNVLAPPADQSS
jgi:hypothetical protein